MRKLLLISLIVVLAVPTVFSARKKDKAGTVSDYVYTDKKHEFSLTLNEEWKYKIQKNKSVFRLVLTQISYPIPSDYSSTPDYTKIPKMVLFVVETKLDSKAFIDSLISPSYKSKTKKELMKEFEILSITSSTGFSPEKLVSRKNKALNLDGKNGTYWTGQVKYTNEVSVSASSQGGKRVKGGYGGAIAAVKDGDKMIVFHLISEWDHFQATFKDGLEIIKSLDCK